MKRYTQKELKNLVNLGVAEDITRGDNETRAKIEYVEGSYKQIGYSTGIYGCSGNENIRFNCIEYLCSFPKINPFVMAASIINDGITILYDDSSISREENRRKERQVKKLLA